MKCLFAEIPCKISIQIHKPEKTALGWWEGTLFFKTKKAFRSAIEKVKCLDMTGVPISMKKGSMTGIIFPVCWRESIRQIEFKGSGPIKENA